MDRSAAQATRTFCSIGHGRVSFHRSEFALYVEPGHELADLCGDRTLKSENSAPEGLHPPGKIHLTTSTR